MTMGSVDGKFLSCVYRLSTSFQLTYGAINNVGSNANIQWMSIGYT